MLQFLNVIATTRQRVVALWHAKIRKLFPHRSQSFDTIVSRNVIGDKLLSLKKFQIVATVVASAQQLWKIFVVLLQENGLSEYLSTITDGVRKIFRQLNIFYTILPKLFSNITLKPLQYKQSFASNICLMKEKIKIPAQWIIDISMI